MRRGEIQVNGIDFVYLEDGPSDGPLALCLHGFPDSAHTWRHLLPELAAAGYRAVAPWSRGYAPTSVPDDGHYGTGALVSDACALHEALGGDERAVLVGHDWGAMAAYGAATHQPHRWYRVVTGAVPPLTAMAGAFFSYDQVKRSFYIFFFAAFPLADAAVAGDDLAFIERLWQDWSPGYDGAEDVAYVKDALRKPDNLAAAVGYYRAMFGDPPPELADEQAATLSVPPQPTLYLHGDDDGCLGVELVTGVEGMLSPGSQLAIVEGTGHFLHLEKPEEVNGRILEFLAR